MSAERITRIQEAVRAEGLDGWLLYDFHKRDPLAYRVLDLIAEGMTTRRWFYFIPAQGEPVRIVHPVEKFSSCRGVISNRPLPAKPGTLKPIRKKRRI